MMTSAQENTGLAGPDVDIADARVFENGHPHDLYDLLRSEDPVHYVLSREGRPAYWLLTRHAEVQAVSRDTRRFTSTQGFRLFEIGGMAQLKPEIRTAISSTVLTLDPPRHEELRRPMEAAFMPRSLAAVRDKVEAFVDEMVAKLHGRDEIEFVSEFAASVPIKTLCLLLGIPREDEDKIFDWTNQLVGTSDPEYAVTPEQTTAVFEHVFEYGRRLMGERRRNPQDDFLSVVANSTIDGKPIDGPERDGMFTLLLAAGNETTRNSLTGSIVALSKFPRERAWLAANLDGLDHAIEELQRFVTPVIQMMRVAKEDVSLGGRSISAGDRVVMLYGAANRDPAVFTNPHALELARPEARQHVSFGVGIHHCLGARLARMQLRILLQRLLTRFPNIEAVSEPRYLRSNFVSGVKSLQVRLA